MRIKRGNATNPIVNPGAAMSITVPDDKAPQVLEICRRFGIPVDGGNPNPAAGQMTPAVVAALANIGAVLE